MPPPPDRRQRQFAVILAVLGGLALIATLRVPGLLLALALVGVVAVVALRTRSGADEELGSLRTAIRLSAEEITDVLDEYDAFAASPDADHLADRTLYRPALLDTDSSDRDIAAFHFQEAASRRFLRRLDRHLANTSLHQGELDKILRLSDERGLQLQEAWWYARRAAKRLGPGTE